MPRYGTSGILFISAVLYRIYFILFYVQIIEVLQKFSNFSISLPFIIHYTLFSLVFHFPANLIFHSLQYTRYTLYNKEIKRN